MKKTLIILTAVCLLGAVGVWGYLKVKVKEFNQQFTCQHFSAGIEDLIFKVDTSSDNLRSANLAQAITVLIDYSTIRLKAPNPASTLSALPVPFTAYNQLASMCKAKPQFAIWNFVSSNAALAYTDIEAANAALDAELKDITVSSHEPELVFAHITRIFEDAGQPLQITK